MSALSVACPYCKSQPEEPCYVISYDARVDGRKEPHAARRRAAQQASLWPDDIKLAMWFIQKVGSLAAAQDAFDRAKRALT